MVDPLIAAAAMGGAVTSTIGFYTQVLKLGSRNPVLLARQVGSVANSPATGSDSASESAGHLRNSNGAARRTPGGANVSTR